MPAAAGPYDAGVTLSIRLLGTPSVDAGGIPRSPPRGRKPWGVLAYLLLHDRAVPREELAALLFAGADDPLGALRWTLAQLRRLLGLPDALRGSPVRLRLPPDAFVDVRALATGTWLTALSLPGLGRELLEGMAFDDSPAFEAWLLAQRRHVASMAQAVLHEGVLARLAAGQSEQAVALAVRLVTMDPLDERHQEALIRALAASGDRVAAARQLAACVELFRRELGVEPGPKVFAAAEASAVTATAGASSGRSAACAQLDAGEAAIGAGAIDAGLECLRRAVAESHTAGDAELKARALLALGSALVHAARGRDEEGAAALHEAATIALRVGRPGLAARAHRELAWIQILHGRYGRALVQIDAAKRIGGDHPFLRALAAACAYQTGRYGEALTAFEEAASALREEDRRAAILCTGEVGVIHLVREEPGPARAALERAVTESRALAWNAYLPLPEALLGMLDLGEGHAILARERLEHAFALGSELHDCCWEGIAAAGLALLDEAGGNGPAAVGRFEDAIRRSVREPDAWQWGHAFVLDLACGFAVRHGLRIAGGWVADLEALAAHTMMREFLARAHLYRAALGAPGAPHAARVVAAGVDNPALHRRIAEAARRRPAAARELYPAVGQSHELSPGEGGKQDRIG